MLLKNKKKKEINRNFGQRDDGATEPIPLWSEDGRRDDDRSTVVNGAMLTTRGFTRLLATAYLKTEQNETWSSLDLSAPLVPDQSMV